ncbi:MAG: SRPBCC family protein [Pirellulales bacterium]|nr:SRPBCC family protein [Pirellulales bacterium]
MYDLQADIEIAASPEKVFHLISDHESFLGDIGGSVCRLTREGSPDRNGLGAVREITADGMRFCEEITAFEPPRRYSYRITEILGKSGKPLPFRHEGGEMVFEPAPGGTRVRWRTSFRVPIPVLGWFVERIFASKMKPAFRQMLERAKSRAESSRANDSG